MLLVVTCKFLLFYGSVLKIHIKWKKSANFIVNCDVHYLFVTLFDPVVYARP